MNLLHYGLFLAALFRQLAYAVQPFSLNTTRIAATAQLQLQRASRALHQRASLHKHRPLARRLQTAGGPCSWQGGACSLSEGYSTDVMNGLPSGSPTRTFYESWRVCVMKSQTECAASMDCYWDAAEIECTTVNDLDINVQDWFNYDGCGILESSQAAAQCEGMTGSCASVPDCSATNFALDVGSDGLCSSRAGCQFTGDMFAVACGSGFNLDAAMTGCTSSIMAGNAQQAAECVTQACPSQSAFWDAFFPAMFTCMGVSTASCINTNDCVVEGGECSPAINAVMKDAIPADCAVRDMFTGIMDCEARSYMDCVSTDCDYDSVARCSASGIPPTITQSCTLREEKMFNTLAAGSCDNEDAQAYARIAMLESQCSAATSDSACGAVTETSSTCAGRATSHARGVVPSSAISVIAMFVLLVLKPQLSVDRK